MKPKSVNERKKVYFLKAVVHFSPVSLATRLQKESLPPNLSGLDKPLLHPCKYLFYGDRLLHFTPWKHLLYGGELKLGKRFWEYCSFTHSDIVYILHF